MFPIIDVFLTVSMAEANCMTAGACGVRSKDDILSKWGNYLLRIAADPPITDVPEPGAMAIFGLGLAGLGYVRRKRAA